MISIAQDCGNSKRDSEEINTAIQAMIDYSGNIQKASSVYKALDSIIKKKNSLK